MDIISNGGLMGKNDIAEIVKRTIDELEIKTSKRYKKQKKTKQIKKKTSIISIPTAKLLKELWKDLIEDSKEIKIEEKEEEFDIKDVKEKETISGGYGSAPKSVGYEISTTNYVNYDKIWGHIGKLQSKSAYQESNVNISISNESSREIVSSETIDKAARHIKYFVRGDIIGDIGFIPPSGIDSQDWEKYRVMSMMSIYRPLLALKRSIA